MGALAYTGPFFLLAFIPVFYAISTAGPLLTPVAILLALIVAENSGGGVRASAPSPAFRILPILYIPLQLLVTLWAAREAGQSASVLALLSLALAAGACTGVFGVLAAHEMVHSRTPWQRQLGAALLTAMTYRHFRIAHIYGHHRLATTEQDPSTARFGESFYAFLPRTLWAQIALSFEFEKRRCDRRGLSLLHNAVLQDLALTCGLYGTVFLIWGARAATFVAAQSGIAIIVLELFNYVAHYGLSRRMAAGAVERLSDRHSWNSPGLGNLLMFNMGHHSHHHRAPSISYDGLRAAIAPELPYGYSGSILLALIPSLWRRIMDPRVYELRGENFDPPRAPAGEIASAAL